MQKKIKLKKAPLIRSNKIIIRPFCGWYDIIRIKPHNGKIDYTLPESKNTLALVEINLAPFSSGDIPENILEKLDGAIGKIAEKRGLIVRALYDWDGCGELYEPESIDIILRHATQLAPLLTSRKNDILLYQGLLVGSWGEMHSSKYLSRHSLGILFDKMTEALDGIQIAVRTPEIRENLSVGRLTQMKRTGIFNDGIFGSETDLGSHSMSRTAAAKYYARCAAHVPYGGEIVSGEGFDPVECLKYLAASSVSYLNSGYDAVALDAMRAARTAGGVSAYDLLERNMGYRFSLTDSAMRDGKIKIAVENLGFSKNYRPLELSIISPGGRIAKAVGEDYIASGGEAVYTADVPQEYGNLRCRMSVGGKAVGAANENDDDGVFLGELKKSLF